MRGLFFIIMLLSAAFSALLGVSLITYVRRTWQLIRAESDDSIQHQILDGIDQLQTRMDLVSERLDRVEGLLSPDPTLLGLEESGQGGEGTLFLPAEDDS
jgi:hypothetical protein